MVRAPPYPIFSDPDNFRRNIRPLKIRLIYSLILFSFTDEHAEICFQLGWCIKTITNFIITFMFLVKSSVNVYFYSMKKHVLRIGLVVEPVGQYLFILVYAYEDELNYIMPILNCNFLLIFLCHFSQLGSRRLGQTLCYPGTTEMICSSLQGFYFVIVKLCIPSFLWSLSQERTNNFMDTFGTENMFYRFLLKQKTE
ncbi:hypothetical protein ACJX0J_030188, partial [Zea mays]